MMTIDFNLARVGIPWITNALFHPDVPSQLACVIQELNV